MKKVLLTLLFILSCTSCINKNDNEEIENEIIKIGYIGEFDVSIWESIMYKKENITLELIPFSDYTALNKAVNSKLIDLNHFQHYDYFINETKKNDYNLGIVAKTFIANMNMYSCKFTNINQISMNSKIALPEDYINLSRALKILNSIGFIKLKDYNNADYHFTIKDITENNLKLDFVFVKSSDMHSIIKEVDAALVNYQFNFDFKNINIIYYDDPSKYYSDMYVNLIVSRLEDEDNEIYKNISSLYKERIKELVTLGELNGITIVD